MTFKKFLTKIKNGKVAKKDLPKANFTVGTAEGFVGPPVHKRLEIDGR